MLEKLYESFTGYRADEITELPGSGSNRRYYRIKGKGGSLIAVSGTSKEENDRFIYLSEHFRRHGLNVPQVLYKDGLCYLQEDLGDEILFDKVSEGRDNGVYSPEEVKLLKDAIAELPRLQFTGARGIDWSKTQGAFNGRMVDFDLNYFKYCFLKATGLEFNETLLQDDFDRLKKDLLSEESNTFMHRDFQARNIMLKDGKPWIIDFQGGRKGPVCYDVASFVWQARARYPEELKKELIGTYLESLRQFTDVDEEHFRSRLRLFVLFRTLQVLGAYGFRGYFEKKLHFIASVPYALSNLRTLLNSPFQDYPHLNSILLQLTRMPQLNDIPENKTLEVHIFSFAYKKGIPADTSGNGGGYVFDCRSVNNPGKYEYYRQFNGMDPEVIKFLEDDGEITTFLESVYSLVDAHVTRFLQRKFTHLQVSFGCTGGQHRSVYSAEHLASHLANKFNVNVIVTHRELDIEKRL
ncbi:MAG: phosphotransferase [Bacteroidales bacterium]|nr:phosphotransferase [Bacteroidales bacterium]